jgi:hypothetical protein
MKNIQIVDGIIQRLENLIEDYYSKEIVYPKNIETFNYYFDEIIFNFFTHLFCLIFVIY